jgi:anti-sigma regulatory factor (Ser/Thr protein kinase)
VPELGREHFPSDDEAPRLARWWLADLLRRERLDHELHDLLVMVSELATNAVKHARSGFAVAVHADDRRIRVEVSDASDSVPQVQWVPAGATSGRGLLIVETLSDGWGVIASEGGGKSVWFEIPLASVVSPPLR